MRIAQISPLIESVPPKLYGGTERIVSYLTEELVRQGHQVTLFASGDSKTAANLMPVAPRALRLDPTVQEPLFHNVLLVDAIMQRAHMFDLIHFHIDALHYPLIRDIAYKTVTTFHGRLDCPDLRILQDAFPEVPVISISDAQREPLPAANWLGTVYHGLPKDLYHLHEKHEGYLAFLGRMSQEKRPDRAIEIAIRAGIPLKIAAKVDRADQRYFDTEIKHLLDHPLIEFIGEINDAGKNDFLGKARALLFPIDWPEPFGLTMIEAMACGTPVIAFNCGSVPEVIDDGITGSIVNSVDEAVEALNWLNKFDRRRVRRRFEERFAVDRMTKDYVVLYNKLLGLARFGRKDRIFA